MIITLQVPHNIASKQFTTEFILFYIFYFVNKKVAIHPTTYRSGGFLAIQG